MYDDDFVSIFSDGAMSDNSVSSDQPVGWWTRAREAAATVRELIVVGALVALVLAPANVRDVLEDARIRSVAGIEFDATTLAESEAQLLASQQKMETLEAQLQEAQTQLASMSSGISRGEMLVRSQAVSRMLGAAQVSAHDANSSLHHSREIHDQVISKARRNGREVPTLTPRQAELTPPDQLFGNGRQEPAISR